VTGNISAFAGQTVQIEFTTLDIPNSVVNGLDNPEFSAQAVPEPPETALLLLGLGGLIGFEFRRRQRGARK